MSEEEALPVNDLDSEILSLNSEAMRFLQEGDFQSSLDHLKQARQLSETSEISPKVSAITLNNLGCYYKRIGKPKPALKWLRQALDLEQDIDWDATNRAGTHLNICAIFSQLGNHEQAMVNAAQALEILQDEEEPTTNAVQTLIIAYYNLGVENEYLRLNKEAQDSYRIGLEIAQDKLGADHELTTSLKQSFLKVSGPTGYLYVGNVVNLGGHSTRPATRQLKTAAGRGKYRTPQTANKRTRKPRSERSADLQLKSIQKSMEQAITREKTVLNKSMGFKSSGKHKNLSFSGSSGTDINPDLRQKLGNQRRFITGSRMKPMFEPDPLSFPKPKPQLRSLPDRRPSLDSALQTSPRVNLQKQMRGIRLFTKAWITIRKKLFIAALKRHARQNRPPIVAKKITPKVINAKPAAAPILPATKVPVSKPDEAKARPQFKKVQPTPKRQPEAKPAPPKSPAKVRNQPSAVKSQPKAPNPLGGNPPPVKVKEPQPRQTTAQRPNPRQVPNIQVSKPQPARAPPKVAKSQLSPPKKALSDTVKLQSVMRMFITRRHTIRYYLRVLWAQKVIGKNMKQFLVTRLYHHIHDAIISIQAWWREQRAKKLNN